MSAHPVPAAWYDVTARVGHARAVAGCINNALSVLNPGVNTIHLDEAINLAGATCDLLDLVMKDVDLLERQLLEVCVR